MVTGQAFFRMSGGLRVKIEGMMKKLVLVMLVALAGCNTVAGVGDDVAGGARTVQGWF